MHWRSCSGLKSPGRRWHERFSDVLRDMGLVPSRGERDIWMRDMGDHYEHIAVCVDDLPFSSRDPQAIVDAFDKQCDFKLKGAGEASFHLGCDVFRDDDGHLCFAPKKCIDKMNDACVRQFGAKPTMKVDQQRRQWAWPWLLSIMLLLR